MRMRIFLSTAYAALFLAGSAAADPQTDEANRQRQMASMRAEAARNDQASANRSLAQQQTLANESRDRPNSGDSSTGAGSSSAGWAGGSSGGSSGGTDSGPQSVVDSYTFTFRVEETTPQILARLTRTAEGGDPGAAFNLARIYYTGFEGVPRDDEAARRYFAVAARAGHAQSQANYGFFLREGIGGATDAKEAARWLRTAAEAGNSFGQAQYAFSLWSSDPEAATPYLLTAAEAGEMAAQALLGSLYAMGYTVPQDDALAVRHLKGAADQGEPGSMGLLAGLYLTGRGGGSEAEGYRLLKQGAEGGDADSMRNYGLMLIQGKGYPKDMAGGAAYVRRAAVEGSAEAQMLLGDLYNEGKGVPEVAEDAIYWWNRAAEAGNAEAIEVMGQVRAAGHAVDRPPTQGTGLMPTQGRK